MAWMRLYAPGVMAMAIAAACSIVSGCATSSLGMKNLPNDVSMVRNKAVLLARIDVEGGNITGDPGSLIMLMLYPDKNVEHITPSGKELTVSSFWYGLKRGKNTLVISLPPGTYRWKTLQVGEGTGAPTFRGQVDTFTAMTLKPGETTYVGDTLIRIDAGSRQFEWRTLDRYDQTVGEFKASHPAIAEAYPAARSQPVPISN
jgi:hypothetical protein